MVLFNTSRPLLSAHPAHYSVTAFLALICLVLLYKQPRYPSIYKAQFATAESSKDLTLGERLQRSEEIFQRSRAARKELTDSFGPDPQSFPFTTDPKGPWPAMTVYDFVSILEPEASHRSCLPVTCWCTKLFLSDNAFLDHPQLYPSFNCPWDVERLGATVGPISCNLCIPF